MGALRALGALVLRQALLTNSTSSGLVEEGFVLAAIRVPDHVAEEAARMELARLLAEARYPIGLVLRHPALHTARVAALPVVRPSDGFPMRSVPLTT